MRPAYTRYREIARNQARVGLTRAMCLLSSPFVSPKRHDGLHRALVLAGPLRGVRLAVSRLERPSYFLGSYERHVIDAVQKNVKDGMVAYDVGGHVGYLSLVMSRLVGSSGSVFTFEPDPQNYAALSANVRDGGMGNITTFPCAVSDVSGEVKFASFAYSLVGRIADATTPSDATLLATPAVSLDDVVYRDGRPAPGFIKIDVEGGETGVIRGATRLLRESRPIIVAEVRKGSTLPEISEIMSSSGYDLSVLYESEWGVLDVVCTPRQ